MLARALRRPLGARVHRTARFARKYNGQNPGTHTTYFQPPPKSSGRTGRFLRSTIIAAAFFALGVVVDIKVISHSLGDVMELADQLGVDPTELLQAMERQSAVTNVPYINLKLAKSMLENRSRFSITPNCIAHYCQFASNMPCEDVHVSGFYGFFTESDRNWSFYGILDGHAGPKTAHLLERLMPLALGDLLWKQGCMSRPYRPNDDFVAEMIKKAFLEVDEAIMESGRSAFESNVSDLSWKYSMIAPALSGSCALLAVLDPANNILRVANTGDSRAVLGRWDAEAGKYLAKPMSVDQTGFNQAEVERLRRQHPGEDVVDPKTGRVHGIAVSRAFGDSRWKWPNDFTQLVHEKLFGPSPRPNGVIKTPPYLTAEPEVSETKIEVGEKPDFLILASDGLWDNMSSEDAVTCVQQWLDVYRPVDHGKRRLRQQPSGDSFHDGPGSPGEPVSYDTTMDDESYYDGQERCLRWRVSPKHFVVEDDQCGVHLIRNALGGSRRNLFCALMGVQPPLSRNVRDDISVEVLFFGQDSAEVRELSEQYRRSRTPEGP